MPKAPASAPRSLLLQKRTNSASTASKCTINALPCQVNHTGPVDASPHYWNPTTVPNDDKSSTSYFRGRRLRGRKVIIPEGYEGVVLKKTGRSVVQRVGGGSDDGWAARGDLEDEEEGDDEDNEEMQVVEQVAAFDHVVVWNHEVLPDPLEDPYSKGITEWIGFADAVCPI